MLQLIDSTTVLVRKNQLVVHAVLAAYNISYILSGYLIGVKKMYVMVLLFHLNQNLKPSNI